jgi:small subunit ribosomal protein S15
MTEEKKEEAKKFDWVKIKPAELEKIVVELYNQGEIPAKIGLILRDKHGIPKAKFLGKRITEILKGAKVTLRSEKARIREQANKLGEHIAKNKHDIPAKKKSVKYTWALSRIKE